MPRNFRWKIRRSEAGEIFLDADFADKRRDFFRHWFLDADFADWRRLFLATDFTDWHCSFCCFLDADFGSPPSRGWQYYRRFLWWLHWYGLGNRCLDKVKSCLWCKHLCNFLFSIDYLLLGLEVDYFGFVKRIWLHFCFGILFVVREAWCGCKKKTLALAESAS